MKKNVLFFTLFLIPSTLTAQHGSLSDWLRGLSVRLSIYSTPAPDHPKQPFSSTDLGKLNDIVYLLSGLRADTFAVASAQWQPTDSTRLLYNADTLLDTKHELQYDADSGWVSYLATFYTYDANKNNTVQLIQQWIDDAKIWVNLSRLLGAYDAQKNLIGLVIQNWNGTDWDSTTHFIHKYDGNNNLISTTIVNKNTFTNSWDSTQRFVFVYDALNNLIADTTYTWVGTGFGYTNLVTYQYNALNQNTVRIGQTYSNNKWKNAWSDTLVYDANGNLLSLTRWGWSQSVKKFALSDAKIEYEYNAANQLVRRVNYNGDGASAFLPSAEYLYTYSVEGNLQESLLKIYNSVAAAFQNFRREVYHYSTLVYQGPSIVALSPALTIFPVPATNTLQLMLTSPTDTEVSCVITDLTGRILSVQRLSVAAGSQLYILNIEHLSPGVHVLQLVSAHDTIYPTRYIVKQ
ncbi:MAG: T9SS type A sorting domain-containing protein [Chitinophagales bacterium]|nr:T9SS type A sorting domain-containing protein [Chitinophagales bacterium]MDW8427340.1 T9SS type A sorting domain-containing protein [Chitinophagales bacterium]